MLRSVDFARPLLTVSPTLDGDVLTTLARGEVELSGGELGRQVAHGSVEGVRRAADRLVEQGVVSRRVAGGAHLYSLNRGHLAARYIEALANLRSELIERLRVLIAGWKQPARVVFLFGSVARGEASVSSDLDLLVVRAAGCDPDDEVWRRQLVELQDAATAWTGNDARLVEFNETELAAQPTEALMEDVITDGIELHGSRRVLRRLLTGASRR